MFGKKTAGTSAQRPGARRGGLQLEPLEQRQMLDAAYINEIYFDPPGSSDIFNEYIELRGTPNMSLDDHFLIFLENENNPFNTGNPGMVELLFEFTGQQMGSNGFLTLRMPGNPYTVAPGTTDIVTTGPRWTNANSNVVVESEDNKFVIENSGFTAMLIKNNGGAASRPFIGQDLDVGNDGLDVPTGHVDWVILDSIGIHSEFGEAQFGRLYGMINFGPENSTNIEPGATYVGVGYEIEYIGRWGNSTGQTADDWHISNLTDNPLSGYTGTGDFRQSAEPHGSANVESNKGVPYGTNLTDTLGAVNYPGVIAPDAQVIGRHIFYNQSKFDGNSAAINASDDAAIAPDKVAFNGIGTAPLSAFTNYSRGINGIMVDIEDAAGTLTVNDFTFKVGANNMPSLWANAPAPNGFSVRAGAGVGGSDRVVITWANNAIQNQWLQVIVEGNDALGGFNTNTGLAASDVFFYGNRIGDTFEASPATIVTTNVSDQISVRGNSAFGQPITAFRDFNKDGLVNVNDEIIARSNGGFLTRIINWVPPAAPEAEPAVASDDSGSAVASALASSSKLGAVLPKVPGWISSRLASVDLNTGTIAKVFTTLAEANTPGTRALLLAANEVTNALDLDDSLLESLIAGMG